MFGTIFAYELTAMLQGRQ